MANTVVGLYDDNATAKQVVQALKDEDFGRNDVHLISTGTSEGMFDSDLVGALSSRGVPMDEAEFYAEGVRRGGSLVMTHAPEDRAEEAAGIMSVHRPVRMPERRAAWEEEGYVAYDPEAEPYTAQQAETERTRYRGEEAGEEVSIPIVEERVKVGKRAVNRGGIRIHSHVEERPVEEQVRLRDEEIDVERREADRALSEEEADEAFRDQDIEMTETDEEAVVEKEARVTEEVVARKRATEREETVRDTVRHTEVDVEGSEGYESHADDFRRHYDENYASGDGDYSAYEPAYRHGYRAGAGDRYRNRNYEDARPAIRREYEEKHGSGTFDRAKGAVRHAFHRGRS